MRFKTYDEYLKFLDHWASPENCPWVCSRCGERWSDEWIRCPDCGGKLYYDEQEGNDNEDQSSAAV